MISILFMLSCPASAFADIACTFTITSIGVTADGWLNVNLYSAQIQPSWFLCNTGGTVTVNNGYSSSISINSSQCQSMLSLFLTARTASRPLILWYHGINDCTTASLPATGPSIFPADITE